MVDKTAVLVCRGGGGLLGVLARDTGEAGGPGVTAGVPGVTAPSPGPKSELAAEAAAPTPENNQ